MSEYKRLTVRHPNSDYIAITETKQLQETRESKIVLNRLAELEDKIMDGTLIELPCKVGDTVYSNERIMFEPLTVKVIVIHQSIKFPVSCTLIAMAKDGRAIYFPSDNFNEDWFLTKTEAEAKLKELQEQNND